MKLIWLEPFSILTRYLHLKLEAIHKKTLWLSVFVANFGDHFYLEHSPRFQSWERNPNPQRYVPKVETLGYVRILDFFWA
ncbi:hypothetical protein ASE21_13915 [Flavobacterium sp. Root901]|nr:hypothetical protein ASE21_13915 [Flavobacterium sp. Root901]